MMSHPETQVDSNQTLQLILHYQTGLSLNLHGKPSLGQTHAPWQLGNLLREAGFEPTNAIAFTRMVLNYHHPLPHFIVQRLAKPWQVRYMNTRPYISAYGIQYP
ncbi:hypothetical protein BGX38DRAFT_216132 [Terfezia claveryi]|nr:hypothetical protein BGX38DRAFT_216132 [Terfezia claveryi]